MNTENSINNTTINVLDNSSNTVESFVTEDTNNLTLETIHNDLGIIVCFLIIFSVVMLCNLIYKFFRMFF